jgi:hypothetical protein
MSELLRDEKLTTADIVSPPRTEFDNRAAAEDGVSTRADPMGKINRNPTHFSLKTNCTIFVRDGIRFKRPLSTNPARP